MFCKKYGRIRKDIPYAEKYIIDWNKTALFSHGILNARHFVLKETIFNWSIYWRKKKNPTIVVFDLIIMGEESITNCFFSFPSLPASLSFCKKLCFPEHFIYSAAAFRGSSQSESLSEPRPRLSAELQMRFQSWQEDYRKQMTYASNLWP